jgi:molybdopterin-guanine dinucleotide biosynthesis protein B
MLIPTICVVGSKNSGKTTVAKEMITDLVSRGLKVAAAKHSHHDFDISAEGRDTTLFQEAGAGDVFFVSPGATTVLRRFDSEEKLQAAAARYAPQADILIAEGWRKSALPKVLVFLEAEKATEREIPSNVIAVVCPVELDIEAPHFKPGQIRELNDHVLSRVLETAHRPALTMLVNGQYVPAKGFVQEFVAGGVLGMLSTLKGAGDIDCVEISIRTRRG